MKASSSLALLATLAVAAGWQLVPTRLAPLSAVGAASTTVRAAQVGCMAKPIDAEGNEIKGALSAYMFFCTERRPALTSALKASMGSEFKTTAVMVQLGAEWKQMKRGEKYRFQALAAADKQRYDAAVASNPANKPAKKAGPKKLSAYMHFCAKRRPDVTAELKASMGAAFKTPAVMVQLGGVEWRALGESDKARFAAMALVPIE